MDLLKKLADMHGISGNEQAVRSFIEKEIKKYVDNVKIDKFGNLIANKAGIANKVVFIAHMDEPGLIVKLINEDGSISFSTVGSIELHSLLNKSVLILAEKKTIKGTVKVRGSRTVLSTQDLIIDTGLSKNELTRFGVEVGSYVSLDQKLIISEDNVSGKALDRIGCFVLLELAKKLKKTKDHIYFVFTVQKEIGLYSSYINDVKPDWAAVVDVAKSEEDLEVVSRVVGKGPFVTIKGPGVMTNKYVNDIIKKIAKNKKIPLQFNISEDKADSLLVSASKIGIPVTEVGVVVRNLNTPISTASISDIENAIKILEELLKNAPKACIV